MNINISKKVKVLVLTFCVLTIALLGIVGWETEQMLFTRFSILYIPMAPSTAYSFLIIGIILLSHQKLKRRQWLIISHITLLIFVLVFSLVVILKWTLGFSWDIEDLFIKQPKEFQEVPMGRMSPLTAFLFILSSISISYLILKSFNYRKIIYGAFVTISLLLSTSLIIGYIADAPLLYGSAYIPVALPTAIAFWFLSIILFVIVDYRFWPFSTFFKTSTESQLSRTFFPIIIVLLIIYTFILNNINNNVKNPTLLLVLVFIGSIPVIGFIIIRVSKQLGKNLEETEEKFKQAITEAPFPIMIHSEGNVIQLSQAWIDISGYTLEDIPTIEVWTEKAYETEAEGAQKYISDLYNLEDNNNDGVWKVRTKSGDYRLWEFKSNPIGLMDNGKKIVSSMAVDVTENELMKLQVKQKSNEIKSQNTEYKRVNEELQLAIKYRKEQEDQLNTLINNLQGMIFHCENDDNWTMRYVSQGVYDLCGYTEDDLIDNKKISWKDIIVSEDQDYVSNTIQSEIEENKKYTLIYKILCSDGTVKTVREQGQHVSTEHGFALEGIITDISQLKKIEKELIEAKEVALRNEKQFKSYSENSSVAIYTTDVNGDTVYVNKKWLKMTGLSFEEAMGRGWKKALHPDDFDTVHQGWKRSVEENGNWLYEYRFVDKEGKITWVEGSVTALRNANQEIVGYVGANIDITKRKNFQEELIKAKNKAEESDRLKTEFINNMSHEIRTPMNGIIGFSDFLKSPNLTPEKQTQYVNIIQSSGQQLLRIIDDILEISRLGTKQLIAQNSKVCLNDLVLELFSVFNIKAKENNTPLFLKKGLTDSESCIFTDRSKLVKVLSNLLENALKFTSVGFVELGYYIEKQQIVIYVKDTGIGIPEDKQEAIFERFSQADKRLSRKFGGLGLGLSIAKENTELIGGKLTLESEPGKGSNFIIRIPHMPVEIKVENKDLEVRALIEKEKHNILIAEDEEINFLFMEILLLKTLAVNANIIHAFDGQEAVEICKERSDIDLVLMDLKMPRLNGIDATKAIKLFRPNLPIVAQTAYSASEDKQMSLAAGCDDFITKPIAKHELREIIERYL